MASNDIEAGVDGDLQATKDTTQVKTVKGILIGQWVLVVALLFVEDSARRHHGLLLLNPIVAIALAPAACYCWLKLMNKEESRVLAHALLLGAILAQAFSLAGLICFWPTVAIALITLFIGWPMLQVVKSIGTVFGPEDGDDYCYSMGLVYFAILVQNMKNFTECWGYMQSCFAKTIGRMF